MLVPCMGTVGPTISIGFVSALLAASTPCAIAGAGGFTITPPGAPMSGLAGAGPPTPWRGTGPREEYEVTSRPRTSALYAATVMTFLAQPGEPTRFLSDTVTVTAGVGGGGGSTLKPCPFLPPY